MIEMNTSAFDCICAPAAVSSGYYSEWYRLICNRQRVWRSDYVQLLNRREPDHYKRIKRSRESDHL